MYVDDKLIAGDHASESQLVKSEFCIRFKMKYLGEADRFLGLLITRNRPERIFRLSQTSYLDKVLERFEMSSSKASATPV